MCINLRNYIETCCNRFFKFLGLMTLATISLQSITASASEMTQNGVADIVEPLLPKVVSIYITNNVNSESEGFWRKLFSSRKVNDFTDKYKINLESLNDSSQAIDALGAGVIVDKSGLIVTNHHLIANANEIIVKLSNGQEWLARVVGADQKSDLALIKVEIDGDLPFAQFDDSDQVRVGDLAIAIGNPFGLGGTVTTGIISAKGNGNINSDLLIDDFLQTDATINLGNSGGPLFNEQGKIIGIISSISKTDVSNTSIGFAVPANIAQAIYTELRDKGVINRSKIGLSVQEVSAELAEAMSVEASGLVVVRVEQGGAAQQAGLLEGDIIKQFNGKKIDSPNKLSLMLAQHQAGDVVEFVIIRQKQEQKISLTISNHSKKTVLNSINDNGIVFANIEHFLQHHQGKGGVYVKSIGEGVKTDLQINDVILKIGEESVNDVEEFRDIQKKLKTLGKDKIVLFIQRGDLNIFVAHRQHS